MLRRMIILLLCSLFVLSLSACGSKEAKDNIESKTSTTDTSVQKNVGNNSENTEQKPEVKNNVDYKVTKLSASKSDNKIKYNIKYPEISGLSDEGKQKEINAILKNEALKVLSYYMDALGSVELNVDYNITLKSPYILSVQYTGSGFASNAAHPNSLFYTTNINMNTGNRLRLKDVINIDKNFANKFLEGGFKPLHSEHSDVLKQHTVEEIQEGFMNADSLDNIGTAQQSDTFMYFTNDSLGISISTGHALGDHAEFETKYQNIKDYIKRDNEIWKYFM
ncbi:PdaC/SigV domain-containing protein [Clostridium paridis]|uniref:DUF4163 domain-containing protein n=1 Tax=Clostridium paridis TaxID=2803863 RepID=A0A937FGN9_9CLOT|nr:DUF4163 domain-containing protein [Clostridium paridis]MBL4931612.1 DUF4163 domain-containing protein [Clostridium paridis]